MAIALCEICRHQCECYDTGAGQLPFMVCLDIRQCLKNEDIIFKERLEKAKLQGE